jgi:hypothetical protein
MIRTALLSTMLGLGLYLSPASAAPQIKCFKPLIFNIPNCVGGFTVDRNGDGRDITKIDPPAVHTPSQDGEGDGGSGGGGGGAPGDGGNPCGGNCGIGNGNGGGDGTGNEGNGHGPK